MSNEQALETYARLFKEILDLPELQKSREVLEGESIVKIVAHALERQYLMGGIFALSEEVFGEDEKEEDND
jgi:hypothetical protein